MRYTSEKIIENTKNFWQQYYIDKVLTDEDASEIFQNVTGFFRLLVEGKLKAKEAQLKDNSESKKSKNTAEKDKTQKEETSKERLIPVTKWNDYYDYPTIGGLRHLIFNEHKNGFDRVVRRIGRRVLIKEDAFFKWVEENNNK